MRPCEESFCDSLSGSRFDERLAVTVVREGKVLASDLAVESWSWQENIDQQVKGALELTVIDDSGILVPYDFDSALAPGSHVIVDYLVSGHRIRFGEYLITKAAPAVELFVHNQLVVSKAGRVKLTCSDLTALLVADRLLAPESPKPGATVASEIRRLARDIPVVFDGSLEATKPVPTSVVYEKERMNAVDDLAARVGGICRMSVEGTLQVIPINPADVVVKIRGGEDGLFISYDSDLDLDSVYNAVISSSGVGTTAEEVFTGKAFETDGPLRWGGPIGNRPLFHSSSLLGSQDAANKDAETRLNTIIRKRFVELSVVAIPDPRIQVGDKVAVPALGTGSRVDAAAIAGVVTSVSLKGSETGVSVSTIKVQIPAADFVAAIKQ